MAANGLIPKDIKVLLKNTVAQEYTMADKVGPHKITIFIHTEATTYFAMHNTFKTMYHSIEQEV